MKPAVLSAVVHLERLHVDALVVKLVVNLTPTVNSYSLGCSKGNILFLQKWQKFVV